MLNTLNNKALKFKNKKQIKMLQWVKVDLYSEI